MGVHQYDLINMNYTDAYNYKHDLESIQLDKQNDSMYTLNFFIMRLTRWK